MKRLLASVRFRYVTKMFLSHLLAVFLVSGSVGTFFYLRAMDNLMRSLQARLQNSAALVSQSISAADLAGVRTPADTRLETYRVALDTMRRIRRTNPDIAYLYIMRLEDGQVSFVVDSDETEAQALPGRVYDAVTPGMSRGFHQASVDDALTEDDWGVFLSGYAPLLHGEGEYLVGIDMRAGEVKAKLSEMRLTGLVSLLASVLLALLFSLYLSRGLTRRIEKLAVQCRRLSIGRFDARVEGRTYDEFDDLAAAFNTMTEVLGQTRTDLGRAIAELETARGELENRVAARTQELQDSRDRMRVMRGLLPICSSCKRIREDTGYWSQVEQFVSAHSEARFTHGICPDCTVQLYGKMTEP